MCGPRCGLRFRTGMMCFAAVIRGDPREHKTRLVPVTHSEIERTNERTKRFPSRHTHKRTGAECHSEIERLQWAIESNHLHALHHLFLSIYHPAEHLHLQKGRVLARSTSGCAWPSDRRAHVLSCPRVSGGRGRGTRTEPKKGLIHASLTHWFHAHPPKKRRKKKTENSRSTRARPRVSMSGSVAQCRVIRRRSTTRSLDDDEAVRMQSLTSHGCLGSHSSDSLDGGGPRCSRYDSERGCADQPRASGQRQTVGVRERALALAFRFLSSDGGISRWI